eukprot:4060453-Pyramimonas_sp.AAC.1
MKVCMIFTVSVQRSCLTIAGQRVERTAINLRHRQQRMYTCGIFTVSVQRSCRNIDGRGLKRTLTIQLRHRH